MFEFNVKQIFLEQIYDVLVVLCIIHFAIVMISFILKWIHPFVKNYALKQGSGDQIYSSEKSRKIFNKRRSQKGKYRPKKEKSEKKVRVLVLDNSDNNSSEEDCSHFGEELQNLSYVSLEPNQKSLKIGNIINDLSFEMNNSVDFKELRMNCKERKSSSEAQTNITINPKVDYSCPKVFLSYKSSSFFIHKNKSSDSFYSASSNSFETEESKFLPTLHSLGCCDFLLEHSKKDDPVHSTDKSLIFVEGSKGFHTNVRKTSSPLKSSYENQICNMDSKILEMAIVEFEKELKPIREQIKVLKDCLNSFDSDGTLSLESDRNSSTNGVFASSECCSEFASTTHGTDILTCDFQSSEIIRKTGGSYIQVLEKPNPRAMPKANFHLSNNVRPIEYKQKLNCNYRSGKQEPSTLGATEVPKLNKRSPLADMYVKLSQSSLHSSSYTKHKKHKTLSNENKKNVTCQINLSFNVESLPSPNVLKGNWIKERKIQPLLSEPEDILGESSGTHISLKPAKYTT